MPDHRRSATSSQSKHQSECIAHHIQQTEGPEIGVTATELSVDLAKLQTWKNAVVAKERSGVAALLKSGVVELKRVAHDGLRVRASAG